MDDNNVVKLSFKQRINYSVGAFGYNFLYYWISAFMAIFCTDVLGIEAGIVSALVLGVRIFDVVNDPIIGSIADRSKLDKNGNRYPKWLRAGSIGLGILVFLLFFTRPEWSMGFKVAWVCVLYCCITVFSTATDMPYGALNGVLTNDGYERSKVSAIRMVLSSAGSNLCGAVALILVAFFSVGGSTANGYAIAVGISAVILIACMLWTAGHTKEVVHPPKAAKIPLKMQFKSFFKNKYSIIAVVSMFATGFNAYSAFTLLTYFFTYYANNANLISVYSIVTLIAGLIGSGIVSTFVVKLFKGKKGSAIKWCALGYAVLYGLLFLVAPNNPLFFIIIFVAQVLVNSQGAIVYSLIGDAADYGEYISGTRCDGFQYSFASLMLKLGGAIGPAALLALLDSFGYMPNQPQNAAVLNVMHCSITFLPAIIGILCFVLYSFYNMDTKMHKKIVEELHSRHERAELENQSNSDV